MLKSFAKTLRDHREGILAYYNFRISTGPLEGTNNKIKTMKREAYGYRDEEFFTLKIFAAHELIVRLGRMSAPEIIGHPSHASENPRRSRLLRNHLGKVRSFRMNLVSDWCEAYNV